MSNILSLEGISPEFPSDNSHWVAPNATIIGKVSLGREVGIWYGAVLRGDNELIEIGDTTNVQEQVIMHTDIGFPLKVGQNCTIGHRALLHGCQVEDNTLIGMGAMVMNGAKIGKNCIIGAGSIVTEGKIIPDNSLVIGVPGRVIKSVTKEQVQLNTASSLHYVKAMNRQKLSTTII